MKIACIASADIAIRFLLLNQILFLKDKGFEVHIICKQGDFIAEIQSHGFQVHSVPFERKISPIQDIKALIKLYRILRREKFDLIHTHTPKASLLGQWASLLANVPRRVHTIQGLYIPANSSHRKQQFWYFIEKLTMYPTHLITSQSREDIATIRKKQLADPSKVVYLGNGIDISRFNPDMISDDQQHALRTELGIGQDQIVIGMVGRLVAEKGFLELFEAAKIISSRMPNCLFLCIGPHEPDKADGLTQAQIEAAQQAADIRFLGMRHDLPALYSVMTMLVHPSHREGFPRVPMEASAMRLPLIVTDIRGCREVVQHGVNGVLIPAHDAQALADAILLLIKHPEQAQVYAQAAYERAQGEFDEQIIWQRVFAAYEQLL